MATTNSLVPRTGDMRKKTFLIILCASEVVSRRNNLKCVVRGRSSVRPLFFVLPKFLCCFIFIKSGRESLQILSPFQAHLATLASDVLFRGRTLPLSRPFVPGEQVKVPAAEALDTTRCGQIHQLHAARLGGKFRYQKNAHGGESVGACRRCRIECYAGAGNTKRRSIRRQIARRDGDRAQLNLTFTAPDSQLMRAGRQAEDLRRILGRHAAGIVRTDRAVAAP